MGWSAGAERGRQIAYIWLTCSSLRDRTYNLTVDSSSGGRLRGDLIRAFSPPHEQVVFPCIAGYAVGEIRCLIRRCATGQALFGHSSSFSVLWSTAMSVCAPAFAGLIRLLHDPTSTCTAGHGAAFGRFRQLHHRWA